MWATGRAAVRAVGAHPALGLAAVLVAAPARARRLRGPVADD
ncbi:hypothetical protein [Streptomyces chromofuscus]|nr:hypothetical protein [Streptomyces chromofuscus]